MTLMILLGAAAALYALLLLFRCAAYALPVFAGATAGLHLHTSGYGWACPILAGVAVAGLAQATGRYLMDAILTGVEANWHVVLAAFSALISAGRCWFDLMSTAVGRTAHAPGS